MPITVNLLTSGIDEDGGNTATVASITTVSGRITEIGISAQPAGGNATPTITDGARTWNLKKHSSYDPATSGNGLTIYSTTSGATGGLTIDFGAAQVGIVWGVVEVVNCNSELQPTEGTGTSLTPNAALAAFGSVNNGTILYAGSPTGRTFTAGTGITEILDLPDVATNANLFIGWRNDNDTAPDCTLSGAGTPAWGAVGIELVFASESGPVVAWITA
jgi:hypothetical protein